MALLNKNSLAKTVDAIEERIFFGESISATQRHAVAQWIAGRQGLEGSYAQMFAPTKQDFENGVRVFTGECLSTRASISHILGEECCRILALLAIKDTKARDAQRAALAGITARFDEAQARGMNTGTYCCGICTCAYWRNIAVNRIGRSEERLAAGMKELAKSRLGNGRWRRFPFYYTCLALMEIGSELAKAQMQYAAPYWEKNLLKRLASSDSSFAKRRFAVGERLLEQC
jgi:hypothetical protein